MDKSRIFVGRQHHGNCFSCCRWKPRNGLRNPLINAMGNRKGLHQPFALSHLWTMNENYEAYKGLGRNTYLNFLKIFGKKQRTRTQTWRQNATTNKLWVVIYHAFKKNPKKSPCRDPNFMIYWFPHSAAPNVINGRNGSFPCLRQRRRTSPEMTIINWAPSSGASEAPKEPRFSGFNTRKVTPPLAVYHSEMGVNHNLTQYFGKL